MQLICAVKLSAGFLRRTEEIQAVMGALNQTTGREIDRWPLWLPVFMMFGVAGYLGLATEPPLWFGISAVIVIGFGAYSCRHRSVWFIGLLFLWVLALGFSVIQWRTVYVAAPVLAKKINGTTVQGHITRVETFPKRLRVTLERVRIHRLDANKTPHRVCLSIRGKQAKLKPGDWVSIRASLSPPPSPAAPGAFDFQRQSFFQGLGAVGFSFGKAQILSPAKPGQASSIQTRLARWRQSITERVLAVYRSPFGAIAAALMTGDRMHHS